MDGVTLNGDRFDIKGVNWFGFEEITGSEPPWGLGTVTQDSVLSQLAEAGFNAILDLEDRATLKALLTLLRQLENPFSRLLHSREAL